MSVSTPPVQNERLVRAAGRPARTAWFMLAILLIFSIAAPLNQFKVPPILPILMDAFHLSVGRSGLLMSVYAVTGLILALPAGLIVQRLGYRAAGLIAGGSVVLGAVLGATSTSVDGMLASRVIEGIGTSFMAVLAPAIIAVGFSAQKRGLAMGLWSTWVPAGSTAMLILAPFLTQALRGTWQAVWWVGGLYALVATALFLAFVKPAPNGAAGGDMPPAPAASASRVLRNRDVWLIGIAFGCFVLAGMSFNTFLPTYLNMAHGVPLSQAALLASAASMLTIFTCPAGGLLSDRIGSRKRPYVAGMLLVAALIALTTFAGAGMLAALVIAQGIVSGLIPTNIFSAGVEAAGDERLGGLAMGVIMVGQNAGMLIGPLVFGALAESSGWPLAFASLAAVCLVGAAAGWLARAQ